jgi:hypothetical protein
MLISLKKQAFFKRQLILYFQRLTCALREFRLGLRNAQTETDFRSLLTEGDYLTSTKEHWLPRG